MIFNMAVAQHYEDMEAAKRHLMQLQRNGTRITEDLAREVAEEFGLSSDGFDYDIEDLIGG